VCVCVCGGGLAVLPLRDVTQNETRLFHNKNNTQTFSNSNDLYLTTLIPVTWQLTPCTAFLKLFIVIELIKKFPAGNPRTNNRVPKRSPLDPFQR
jgi:hypothetical protein